ncbi:MAG: ATP-binding cassette domain-containing protein [Calditrichaeota bacterium]|nr:ATP-binding cassette domain-containing protein [Calditrichota bacterium]
MLKLLNVTYRYAGGHGVSGVSFDLARGEFALLTGRTGAGKTTLLKLISLELAADAGEITLERFRSSGLPDRLKPQWRRRLGIVHQDLHLLDDRSTLENVILAARCETSLNHSRGRAVRALNRVGLAQKLNARPSHLSTGERQRAAIARALVNDPFLLLADEPVSNLDAETSAEIVEHLARVSRNGTAVLVATHQPERFEHLRPVVLKMDHGHLER